MCSNSVCDLNIFQHIIQHAHTRMRTRTHTTISQTTVPYPKTELIALLVAAFDEAHNDKKTSSGDMVKIFI